MRSIPVLAAALLVSGAASGAAPMLVRLSASADFDDTGQITSIEWQDDANAALQAALEAGLLRTTLQLGPEVSARRTHLSLRVRLDPDGDDLVPTVETMRAGPAVLSLKPARYPKSALRRRVSALILAHFDVTPAGEVTELRIEGDHDGLFRAAVEEALHAWRFAPESRGGTPVASPMCVPFRFTIVGAKAESPEHDALHCPEQLRGVRAPGQRPGFDEIEISARRGR